MHRRFFRFAYPMPSPQGRPQRLHRLRDGDAFAELSPVLYSAGLEYGGLVINARADGGAAPTPDFLRPGDLLVLTTRPPLHDRGRKPIQRSRTPLEDAVFGALLPHLDFCSRSRVRLAAPLAAALPPEDVDRGDIAFHVYERASYARLRERGSTRWRRLRDDDRTAAYLVHAPLPGTRAHVLAAFGLGGPESLVWAHRLRAGLWRELRLGTPRCVVAEITMGTVPDSPASLGFCETWPLRVLLDAPIA